MSGRVEAGQSVHPQEPSGREGSPRKNSHPIRNLVIVGIGGAAAIATAVACGNGRVEPPKTPFSDGTNVAEKVRTPEIALTERTVACDITQASFDAARKINGKNWWEIASKGDVTYREVLETYKYDANGNQLPYLAHILTSHGGAGIYVERTVGEVKQRIGNVDDLRQALFDDMFPGDKAKPLSVRIPVGSEPEVAAIFTALDPGIVTQVGDKELTFERTSNPQINITLGRRGLNPDTRGQVVATAVDVTASTAGSPVNSQDFPISERLGDNLGMVDGICK